MEHVRVIISLGLPLLDTLLMSTGLRHRARGAARGALLPDGGQSNEDPIMHSLIPGI